MQPGIIVVGWPGVGKSHVAKHLKDWVNIDKPGMPTQEYIQHIRDVLASGKNVLLPTWIKTRDALDAANLKYVMVLPARDLKADYHARYHKRGSDQVMIDAMCKNWDIQWDGCYAEKVHHRIIMRRSGDYLEDYIPEIVKRFS